MRADGEEENSLNFISRMALQHSEPQAKEEDAKLRFCVVLYFTLYANMSHLID